MASPNWLKKLAGSFGYEAQPGQTIDELSGYKPLEITPDGDESRTEMLDDRSQAEKALGSIPVLVPPKPRLGRQLLGALAGGYGGWQAAAGRPEAAAVGFDAAQKIRDGGFSEQVKAQDRKIQLAVQQGKLADEAEDRKQRATQGAAMASTMRAQAEMYSGASRANAEGKAEIAREQMRINALKQFKPDEHAMLVEPGAPEPDDPQYELVNTLKDGAKVYRLSKDAQDNVYMSPGHAALLNAGLQGTGYQFPTDGAPMSKFEAEQLSKLAQIGLRNLGAERKAKLQIEAARALAAQKNALTRELAAARVSNNLSAEQKIRMQLARLNVDEARLHATITATTPEVQAGQSAQYSDQKFGTARGILNEMIPSK